MKKQFGLFVLSLLLLTFWIPKETLAEGNTYPLNVGNITVTDENASDITGKTLKNGYAHFNPATNTLSLWNCTIDTTTSTYGIIWKSSEDLHVRLHGINFLVSENGIFTYGNLFLEGDGELKIKTPKKCINERHIGIRASTLTVCEAARIVINEPVEPECSGFKGENLVLKDNVTFTIDTAYVGLDLSKAEKCKLEMRNNAICNIFSSVKSGVLPFWVPKESEDSYKPDKKKFSIEMDPSIYLCVYGPTEYDDRKMGALSYFYYALDKPGMIYKTTDLTFQSHVSYTLDPSGSYATGFEFYLVCYSILTDSDQTWRSDTYALNYVLGSKPTDVISTTVPKRHSKATIMDCTRGKREADCRLVGWTYTEGSGQVDVSIGEILTLSKDVTLYPVWEYKVSLTGENAKASVNDAPVQWVKAGEKVDLSVGDIATNKRFKSWQSGNVTIEQANQENAYFIMPSSAVQVTYVLDTYIDEMMVTGFAQPMENGLVSGYEVSLPESETHIPYQIVTQQWKYADDSLCSGSFATTQPCKLCITVQAEEGYVFDKMSAIKVINELGGLETITNLVLASDNRTVSFETEGRDVQSQGSEISTIRVIGAQKPVAGNTALQGDALGLQVAGGLGYDLYVPYWSDLDGEAGNIFSGTFQDGHTYALVMEVRAQTGFTFSSKAGLSAIVNGTAVPVEDINYRNNTDVYLFARYKLPAAIQQVEINGMGTQYLGDDSTQYQLTVPKNCGYYVKNAGTGWYTDTDVPFTGSFENGKTYRFKVSLGLEAEQKFAGMTDMTFTFDGQPATVEQWDNILNQYVLSREITIHDMVQERENIEPTCLYAGAKAYFKCKICEKTYVDHRGEVEIPDFSAWDQTEGRIVPLEHTPVLQNKKDATTKEPGYTGDLVCDVCNSVLKKGEVIEKLKEEDPEDKTPIDPIDPIDPKEPGKEDDKENTKGYADYDEKAILERTDDKDSTDSSYAPICLRITKLAKKSLTIKWNRVNGATGYNVYAAACNKGGKKYKFGKVATLDAKNTSYTYRNLKKGTYYKVLVMAVNEKKTLAISKTVHGATTGGTANNLKSFAVNKSKITLKKGKSIKLKITKKVWSKKGKGKLHRVFGYESTNPSIAKVSSKGVVKGVKKGSCFIYVYAPNGSYKKIRVKVNKG